MAQGSILKQSLLVYMHTLSHNNDSPNEPRHVSGIGGWTSLLKADLCHGCFYVVVIQPLLLLCSDIERYSRQ